MYVRLYRIEYRNKNLEIEQSLAKIEISFKLFEFSILQLTFFQSTQIDLEPLDRDLIIDLGIHRVDYLGDEFREVSRVISISSVAVSAAFGVSAICLDSELENLEQDSIKFGELKDLIAAVRNSYAHGIAEPRSFVKQHRLKAIDLAYLDGPLIDLGKLNGTLFDYEQIGILETWIRIKEEVVRKIKLLR